MRTSSENDHSFARTSPIYIVNGYLLFSLLGPLQSHTFSRFRLFFSTIGTFLTSFSPSLVSTDTIHYEAKQRDWSLEEHRDPCQSQVTHLTMTNENTATYRGGGGGLRFRDMREDNMGGARALSNKQNIPNDSGAVVVGGKENAPSSRFHQNKGRHEKAGPKQTMKKKPFISLKNNTFQSSTTEVIDANVKTVHPKDTIPIATKNTSSTNSQKENTIKMQTSKKQTEASGRGLLRMMHNRNKEQQAAVQQQQKVIALEESDDDDSIEDYEDYIALKRTNSFDEFASYWESEDEVRSGFNLASMSKDFDYDADEDADDEGGDASTKKQVLGNLVQETIQLSVADPAILVNKGKLTGIAQELVVGIQAISKELNMTEDDSFVLIDDSKQEFNRRADPWGNVADFRDDQDLHDDSCSSSEDLEILALCRPTLTGAAAKNNKGYELLQKGNYEKAMALFNQAREDLLEVGCTGALHPRLPLLKNQLDDDALEVACAMEMANVVSNMAEYHLRMKDYDMVTSTAKTALECDPNNDRAWLCMARAEFHMKRYYQAALAAEKVKSTHSSYAESRILYQLIQHELQPAINEHEATFRRIIDSYRLRVADEFEIGIIGRNSIFDIQNRNESEEAEDSDDEQEAFSNVGTFVRGSSTVGLLLTGDYFKSLPLTHFRGYLRSLRTRSNSLPRKLKDRIMPPSGDLLQALCFMAISDDFSNIRFPTTKGEIEAHFKGKGGMEDTVESLRQYAQNALGPVTGKVNVIECFMSDSEEMFNEKTFSEINII